MSFSFLLKLKLVLISQENLKTYISIVSPYFSLYGVFYIINNISI